MRDYLRGFISFFGFIDLKDIKLALLWSVLFMIFFGGFKHFEFKYMAYVFYISFTIAINSLLCINFTIFKIAERKYKKINA